MLSVERLLEYGPLGLFLVAFFESTVFPIPPDVLLLPLCLMNPRLSWWYAFLTTAASISGAFLGYAVGRKAGRPVVERFVAGELVEKVQVLFEKYGGWAVGIAAFTPIPYKVFTFGAGVFRVPFMTFTVASAIGRAGRFFFEGGHGVLPRRACPDLPRPQFRARHSGPYGYPACGCGGISKDRLLSQEARRAPKPRFPESCQSFL
jgi:membrane protein YqaA with SNARE-associated domain